MRLGFMRWTALGGLIAGALTFSTPAYGQLFRRDGADCQPVPPPPCVTPGTPAAPPAAPPAAAAPVTPTPAPTFDISSLTPESGIARAGSEAIVSEVGYIDSAIPTTMFRFRADAAFDDNRPDRAEFFYAKCGCFRGTAAAPGPDTTALGPGTVGENHVDYQEFASYLEVALSKRFSAFVELPVRLIELNDNHSEFGGFGDLNFGFKAAAIADCDRYLTFQFRTYVPTGDPFDGLGTGHVSLEPALLGYHRLTDKIAVEAEFRDWIPIGGSDFAGNVIRYGAGISYEVYSSRGIRVVPIVELVGWTVLSGKELDLGSTAPNGVVDATGDTIVNAKIGVRTSWGEHSDLYLGYGRAITDDVWYKNIVRMEYRFLY
jgi:hypothetical protein